MDRRISRTPCRYARISFEGEEAIRHSKLEADIIVTSARSRRRMAKSESGDKVENGCDDTIESIMTFTS